MSTGAAIFFTSSGWTKLRPEIAASAWLDRNRAIEARGLAAQRQVVAFPGAVNDQRQVAAHFLFQRGPPARRAGRPATRRP